MYKVYDNAQLLVTFIDIGYGSSLQSLKFPRRIFNIKC